VWRLARHQDTLRRRALAAVFAGLAGLSEGAARRKQTWMIWRHPAQFLVVCGGADSERPWRFLCYEVLARLGRRYDGRPRLDLAA